MHYQCVLCFLCLHQFSDALQAQNARDTIVDTVRVQGYSSSRVSGVNQKSIERANGIIEDLGTLLTRNPGVNSVPESGSLLVVNGEGPFDNLYLIRGIPIFPPSDFAGHSFADRSVVTLALPNDINCYSSRLVSQYSGASGSVITINPYSLVTPDRLPRPEAALALSTLTSDFSLNVPVRNNCDRYQASLSIPNNYSLLQNDYAYGESSNLGYGYPASSWNVRTIGEQNVNSLKIEQLGWIGMDEYADTLTGVQQLSEGGKLKLTVPKYQYPWGILSVSARDTLAKVPWDISLGGSRQFILESQELGVFTPIEKVERRNLALNLHASFFPDASSSLSVSVLAERLFADDSLEIKDSQGTNLSFCRDFTNNNAQVHVGYKRQIEWLLLELHSIQGFYYGGRSTFVDPGFSLKAPVPFGTILFSSEINSAPADIRMLPSEEFDSFLSHTYHSHLTLSCNILRGVKINAEAFAKWKDHLPLAYDDPLRPYLDSQRNASLKIVGGNLQIGLMTGKRFSLTNSTSLCRSTVVEGKSRYPYDWDSPWANKTSLAFSIIPGKMTMYCIGNFSAGFPYRNLESDTSLRWSDERFRIDDYKCVDLKFEWRQPTDGNLLTEYDAFIYVQNVLNFTNVREYEWGTGNTKYPVTLQPVTINVGARVNLRFFYW
jgi:hypothetical protein